MYTITEQDTLDKMYSAGAEIKDIAEAVDKSQKSVIAKLVAMKIYEPKIKVSKVTGDKPRTKLSYMKDIENKLETKLPGLDKAPKGTLVTLLTEIEAWLGED